MKKSCDVDFVAVPVRIRQQSTVALTPQERWKKYGRSHSEPITDENRATVSFTDRNGKLWTNIPIE